MMKKNLFRTFAALLALVTIVSLAGCAKKTDGSSAAAGVVGTWRMTKVNGDDLETAFTKQAEAQGMTLEELLTSLNSIAAMAGSDFTLTMQTLRDYSLMTLKEDGAVTLVSLGMEMNGTWSQNGNAVTVTITSEEEPVEQVFTLENGELRLTNPDSGDVMIYEKD